VNEAEIFLTSHVMISEFTIEKVFEKSSVTRVSHIDLAVRLACATCVTASARKRGLGSGLVRRGIEILTQKNCDIACLNANIKKYSSGGLYYRLGFRLMRRGISFTDANGTKRHDTGEMFIPIRSNDLYELVMNSRKTFHIGRGYW
jgi:GNAT superfamily N-acetyltransferase